MLILGLTGSMGMGKSTVSGMFRKHGIPVFCMDNAVHAARGPNGEALPAIEALIPGSTNPETGADIQKLRVWAFGSGSLEALEVVMLPAILKRLNTFFEEQSEKPIVVLDVPLLFERGFDKRVHEIVVVAASPEVQMERVMARGTLTKRQALDLIARQMPSEQKVQMADHIINTDCSLEETEAQVDVLIEKLTK